MQFQGCKFDTIRRRSSKILFLLGKGTTRTVCAPGGSSFSSFSLSRRACALSSPSGRCVNRLISKAAPAPRMSRMGIILPGLKLATAKEVQVPTPTSDQINTPYPLESPVSCSNHSQRLFTTDNMPLCKRTVFCQRDLNRQLCRVLVLIRVRVDRYPHKQLLRIPHLLREVCNAICRSAVHTEVPTSFKVYSI